MEVCLDAFLTEPGTGKKWMDEALTHRPRVAHRGEPGPTRNQIFYQRISLAEVLVARSLLCEILS